MHWESHKEIQSASKQMKERGVSRLPLDSGRGTEEKVAGSGEGSAWSGLEGNIKWTHMKQ